MENKKPIIGITLGDYNGIGPEVILKALSKTAFVNYCTPVIYGSQKVINYYRKSLQIKEWNAQIITEIEQINFKSINLINCWEDKNTEIEPGKVTTKAGEAALECLKKATADLKDGKIQGIVTAPINKNNIQTENFKFPGHTEFFAENFEAKNPLMFMVSDDLKVGVVTGHIPLEQVKKNIHTEKINLKIQAIQQSLKQDFGIQKPKIAILGLNPHAGENGLLGNEEKNVITPCIENLKKKGHLLFGPFAADGFFAADTYKQYDAVLAMYHDQGLIPFKYIAYGKGVNFTAGLSIVRTSPDHGTAYDIAGKNIANESSMITAIFNAIDILKQRNFFVEE
ncbi:MAG: 4-hydroxythreonine-4-phosphate dehydrogenase PdxA [Pseudarcicella sp.]|jgi:4-hydroxythreonine-4-phosphate dehydrogenase|nr:4-hydroxythreonine-4-phosphate dehydrogenase PdxA [Pseudarcicella sp.]MBP6410438.1 4-hydroxythreonine-4-phosphate dehydrogenase PdxA [Pseudarcicella sp.]